MLRKVTVVVSLTVWLAVGAALPAAAEGSVSDWNLGTLAAGKVYPTTITAINRCDRQQTFEITLEGMAWMRLTEPATFSVSAGGQRSVAVELDTRGLAAGSYSGTAVIHCLTCKPPRCNQDRDSLRVALVVPAVPVASAPPEPTTEEVISGLHEGGPEPAFAPSTEGGIAAKGPCDVIRQQWREAAQLVKDSKSDCDEKRRKMMVAQDEARKAREAADAAKRVEESKRADREKADAEFKKVQADHDAFVRKILSGVDGIRLGQPFEANPERVWEEGYRYHGMTTPVGGLYYRDEKGLLNLIEKLDKWRDELRIAEEKLKAKSDALKSADEALKRAEEEAKAAAQNADDKQGAADRATREYLACIGQMQEAVARANNLLTRANECLEIARQSEAEEIEKKRLEAERLAKLEIQKKEEERSRTTTRPSPPSVPVLSEPQELTGGLRQVRIALYTEVKARAMEHYDPNDCRYRCEKLLQSLLGEDFSDMVRDLGLDVISASLSAFPAESTAQKYAVHAAKALLGLGKGKGVVEVLSDRAAAIVGGSLLPKVYGDWLGKQVNTFSTPAATKALKEALDRGDIQAWEVDKTVEGHLGGGEMFSCPVHMRMLYSKVTGYVVAVATCSCPRCPVKTMIFRYRSDREGQPIGDVEVIE